MSPKEKFEELRKDYSHEYITKVARNMTLHYAGIGQKQLRDFWSQVEEISIFNKTKTDE